MPRLTILKTLNLGTIISTRLQILKTGNFFRCRAVKKLEIWPKNWAQLKILTFALSSYSHISNGQNSEFVAHNFNSSKNSNTFQLLSFPSADQSKIRIFKLLSFPSADQSKIRILAKKITTANNSDFSWIFWFASSQWSKTWILGPKFQCDNFNLQFQLGSVKNFDFCVNFMIPNLAIVKTLNFRTTISTRLRILKIDFYQFQVQSSWEVRILPQHVSTAKNPDFCLNFMIPI